MQNFQLRSIKNGFFSCFLGLTKIIEKFDVWRKASGLFWIDFLVEIQKNSLTGEWAKDVVKHLIKEDNGNVK